jgi:hypothetical protein
MHRFSGRSVLFHEEQAFRQVGLWVLLLSSVVLVIAIFGYGLFQQWVLGRPWSDRPLSDSALLLVATSSIGLTLGIVWLFYRLKLITEVRDDGVYVRFFPWRAKLIPFRDINRCEVRTYRPIREYGGWGIRYGRNGKAYNVSGDRGVQLEFIKGCSLLIGSQQPTAEAINRQRAAKQ